MDARLLLGYSSGIRNLLRHQELWTFRASETTKRNIGKANLQPIYISELLPIIFGFVFFSSEGQRRIIWPHFFSSFVFFIQHLHCSAPSKPAPGYFFLLVSYQILRFYC